MPTYEYECIKCGLHFEKFQMMSDEPLRVCPKCKKPLRRLIGKGGGVIFKGAGFYATDYRKSRPAQDDKKDTKEKTTEKTCLQAKNPKGPSCNGCPLEKSKGG